MKHFARLWGNMLARRTLSMVLCLTLAVTSGGVCIASTTNLAQETRAAGENQEQLEREPETAAVVPETKEASSKPEEMEGEALEDDINGEEEPEDTRCLHEFTAVWVGYECKLTDYVEGYEPGDEVRISASFNKAVTSQIGLYIDGAWNSFRGEGKKRNITLVPDSDYLNIQISDMKGAPSVNLTEISVEIVRKGEADTGSYLHKFTGLWQGFETKFSDYNPDYDPGDEIRVTVNFSKYVSSQLGMNIDGQWSTLTGDGKEISKEVKPDNDYLNIQITDMWANYKVGVISVSVDILKKGPGGSGYGGGGGRLEPTQYTEPGDYLLFSGEPNGKYETNDGWLLDCADTDWITLRYSCVEDHENWGVLGWGATVDGEWVDGPGYSADSGDSTKEVTQTFSVKYLRRMMKITPESNVSYLNLGSYSDGKIEELTLHVGSEIPRERSLFKNGDPNQAWVCTDIERILDAPDEKYLCVQYRCAVSDFEGWTILSWGASVDGEWKNGKSYKASYKEANREQFFSMRMDSFRNMLHLSWDVKVDTIQLAAYNDGQIMDIWISDEKVTDPGDEKRVRPDREGDYRSSNEGTYVDNLNKNGTRYPQDIDLGPWGWTAGDNSLDHEQDIIDQIGEGKYLVIEYEAEKENIPNLQFTVVDDRYENGTKQQQVTPTYTINGQALFAYRDIQGFLSSYLIPHEVKNLQISAQDGNMSIKGIRIVEDNEPLEDEPIAVLTKSWGTFGTEISRWHSDYEAGDTVKATATFDKKAPGTIAFTIGGVWSTNGYADSQTISRTGRPDNDHMDIQIGQMPDYKSHVKITNIKVEIPGKKNFNEYVYVEGKRSAGILASTMREAATAILRDDEINKGVHTAIVLENSSLTEDEKTQVTDLFGGQDSVRIAKVSDVRVYKETGGKRTQLSETDDPFRIKVPVPDNLRRSSYDFAVMRLHDGEWTFLEDLDGNTDTVTFASDKFSKFAIIYGEPGAFDELSGAIRVFRNEWSGWETKFSDYNHKYQAGKPTKVTLTFDKEVGAYIDYHNPDWTRTPGDGEEVLTGKTFTRTITPSDDSLTIGIANLNGNSTVKLLNMLVEQDQEAIKTFTQTNEELTTTFSKYNPSFVKGNETVVTLTFDKPVKSSIGYNNPGATSSASNESGTEHKITVIPSDDVLRIWLTDLGGNSSVKLLDVKVEQPNVETLYDFESAWGGANGTYASQFSNHMAQGQSFVVGKKTTVKMIFNNKTKVKLQGGLSVEQGPDIKEDVVQIVEGVPTGDDFSIQVSSVPGGKVSLLSVEVTQSGDVEPENYVHKFEKKEDGSYDSYSLELVKYLPDHEPQKDQVKIRVELSSENGFSGTLAGNVMDTSNPNSSKWEKAKGDIGIDAVESNGKYNAIFEWMTTPYYGNISVQIWNSAGDASQKIYIDHIDVERIDVEEAIHTFKKKENGEYDSYSLELAKYLSDHEPQKDQVKIRVELSSDNGFSGTLAGNVVDTSNPSSSKWEKAKGDTGIDAVENNGKYTAIFEWTTIPYYGDMSVQIWNSAGDASQEIYIDKINVDRATSSFSLNHIIMSEDYVHMFTEPGTIILELSDYYDEYELGQGVEVEMNLFSDGNFFARVEDADFVTITDSNETPAETPSVEEPGKATDSDAEPAVATGSDAVPAKARTKAKGKAKAVDTELSAEPVLEDMPETATASDAEKILATASNGTPAVTVKPAGSTETSGTLVYENDEDGTMTVRWYGNPQSGAIAVTILEMDGTQVNIDTVDVEENANAVSVKAGAMSAAKKLSAEICPNQTSDSQEDEASLEQDPAKKEEDLTGLLDETLSEVLDMPDGKPEEPEEEAEGEERAEENMGDSLAESETAFVEETDYSERETED